MLFFLCVFFVLMGLGTVIKGDIENLKEAMIMAAYLLYFIFARSNQRKAVEKDQLRNFAGASSFRQ